MYISLSHIIIINDDIHIMKQLSLTICSADIKCKSLLWAHLKRCPFPAEHIKSTIIATYGCPG